MKEPVQRHRLLEWIIFLDSGHRVYVLTLNLVCESGVEQTIAIG
jgi:hypothetical protein